MTHIAHFPNLNSGELLLDQKRFEDAIEKFDRAIEIEKAGKPPINVLAMVNKGLTVFQWKNDLNEAEKIIGEALELDPECEAAVATLAQISLQQGKVERAGELFRKQVDLARTEADIANALQFAYVRIRSLSFLPMCSDLSFHLSFVRIGCRGSIRVRKKLPRCRPDLSLRG